MSLPRAPKAVVFDMDGLLCDTEAVYRDAMIAVAAELGFEMTLPMFLSLVGLPATTGDARLSEMFGEGFSRPDFYAGVYRRVEGACAAGIPLKTGVGELLDHLDLLGLPRAIATSSSHQAVQAHLGLSGVIPRFNAIVALGDYARGKPHPDPFLTAAARLGVDPTDCLALEDSHNGVRAAAAAGMMTIMVPDLLHATEEMQALCIRIAEDLHEVQRLIRGAA